MLEFSSSYFSKQLENQTQSLIKITNDPKSVTIAQEQLLNYKINEEEKENESNVNILQFYYLLKRTKSSIFQQFSSLKSEIKVDKLLIGYSHATNQEIEQMLAADWANYVKVIDLTSNNSYISDDVIDCIVNKKNVQFLQELYFNNNKKLTDGIAIRLNNSQNLINLIKLDLDNCNISDEGLKTIMSANFMETLEFLQISRNPLVKNIQGILQLKNKNLALKYLGLAFDHVVGEGFKNLVDSELLYQKQFETLDISHANKDFVKEMNQSLQYWKDQQKEKQTYLKQLIMQEVRIDQDGFKTLQGINFAQLEQLDLQENPTFSTQEIIIEENSQLFKNLKCVNLKKCDLNLNLTTFLKQTQKLESLDISYNEKFSDKALQDMVEIFNTEKLKIRQLGLAGLYLCEKSLKILSGLKTSESLEVLYIRQNLFTDQSLLEFLETQNFSNLKLLNLAACNLTFNSLKIILEKFPLLEVLRFSENNLQMGNMLTCFLENYQKSKNLIQISLGSAIDHHTEVLEKMEKKIEVVPFFGDSFD